MPGRTLAEPLFEKAASRSSACGRILTPLLLLVSGILACWVLDQTVSADRFGPPSLDRDVVAELVQNAGLQHKDDPGWEALAELAAGILCEPAEQQGSREERRLESQAPSKTAVKSQSPADLGVGKRTLKDLLKLHLHKPKPCVDRVVEALAAAVPDLANKVEQASLQEQGSGKADAIVQKQEDAVAEQVLNHAWKNIKGEEETEAALRSAKLKRAAEARRVAAARRAASQSTALAGQAKNVTPMLLLPPPSEHRATYAAILRTPTPRAAVEQAPLPPTYSGRRHIQDTDAPATPRSAEEQAPLPPTYSRRQGQVTSEKDVPQQRTNVGLAQFRRSMESDFDADKAKRAARLKQAAEVRRVAKARQAMATSKQAALKEAAESALERFRKSMELEEAKRWMAESSDDAEGIALTPKLSLPSVWANNRRSFADVIKTPKPVVESATPSSGSKAEPFDSRFHLQPLPRLRASLPSSRSLPQGPGQRQQAIHQLARR